MTGGSDGTTAEAEAVEVDRGHDRQRQIFYSLSCLYRALTALSREVTNPRTFEVLTEGHFKEIRRLMVELENECDYYKLRERCRRRRGK